jgi:predicted oxidoreductase
LLDPNEVARAFSTLKAEGKVLHFGVSNFTPSQFQMLQSYLDFPLVTNQIEVSVTHQHALFDGTMDDMMRLRVAPMAWSPLGGGKLVTKPSANLLAKAAKYRATPSQLLLAWLLRHPAGIFPVIGSSKPERISEAAEAINVQLDLQDWFDLWKDAKGKQVP